MKKKDNEIQISIVMKKGTSGKTSYIDIKTTCISNNVLSNTSQSEKQLMLIFFIYVKTHFNYFVEQ